MMQTLWMYLLSQALIQSNNNAWMYWNESIALVLYCELIVVLFAQDDGISTWLSVFFQVHSNTLHLLSP